MDKNIRVFFVVDSESIETPREIFTTLDEAKEHCGRVENGSILISIVRHAYYAEEIKAWNYNDVSDTFEDIKIIVEKN